jgi:hypothetical protein
LSEAKLFRRNNGRTSLDGVAEEKQSFDKLRTNGSLRR